MEDMRVIYRAIIINKSLNVCACYATQYDAKHMLIKTSVTNKQIKRLLLCSSIYRAIYNGKSHTDKMLAYINVF